MELLRALGALAEVPRPELAPIASRLELGALPEAHEHTELFGFQLVPYASIYLGDEGRVGGDARERILGFWRAVGREPDPEADQLTLLLASYAGLCEADGDPAGDSRGAARHHRSVFLHEHLLSWLPVYLLSVRRLAPPFYRRWADLLLDVLEAQARELGEAGTEVVHFRESAPYPGTDATIEEMLDALLAPVRSGVLIARRDLADAARELGIASRMGERRYMLEAMLRQSPAGTVERLAAHCAAAAEAYEAIGGPIGRSLDPWAARVRQTRNRLATS